MTNSKLVSKKVLIPAAIVAVAVGLTFYGLSPAIAAVNQTINSAAPGYAQLPKITGSVNVGQTVKSFMNDNLKVSFPQASEIAAKHSVAEPENGPGHALARSPTPGRAGIPGRPRV